MMIQFTHGKIQKFTLTWSDSRKDAKWQLLPVIAKRMTTDLKLQTQMHQQLLAACAYDEVKIVQRFALMPLIMVQQQPALTTIRLSHPVVWNSAKHQLVDAVVILQLDDGNGDQENQRVITDCIKLLTQSASVDEFPLLAQHHLVW